MKIQRHSSNTATRCLLTADSLEIGSFHATFNEVRSMNCVRGKSRMFVIPNQKTVLVICTKFYSAKSIHDPFRQNFLSAVSRDLQATPPSCTKQQARPALRNWDLTFIPYFSALFLLCVVFITIFLSAVEKFNDALGPQKWKPKAELRMLSVSMFCLSKSEGQHIATRPLAPTSSSFLKNKVVRVDDLVQGEEGVIVQRGRDSCIVTLSKYVWGTKQMWGTWFRIINPITCLSCR